MPSDIKPSPGPMLTQIYVVTVVTMSLYHIALLGHTELNLNLAKSVFYRSGKYVALDILYHEYRAALNYPRVE